MKNRGNSNYYLLGVNVRWIHGSTVRKFPKANNFAKNFTWDNRKNDIRIHPAHENSDYANFEFVLSKKKPFDSITIPIIVEKTETGFIDLITGEKIDFSKYADAFDQLRIGTEYALDPIYVLEVVSSVDSDYLSKYLEALNTTVSYINDYYIELLSEMKNENRSSDTFDSSRNDALQYIEGYKRTRRARINKILGN